MDEKGEHLVIRDDGRWGCVVNSGATGKAHRKRVFALAGMASAGGPYQGAPSVTERQKRG